MISYINKVYFDVSMHYRVLFNEDAFAESLLNSGSMKEKLLFLPLNLVFRIRTDVEPEMSHTELEDQSEILHQTGKENTKNVGKAPMQFMVEKHLHIYRNDKEFKYLPKKQRYDLGGVLLRTPKNNIVVYSYKEGTWRRYKQERLAVC